MIVDIIKKGPQFTDIPRLHGGPVYTEHQSKCTAKVSWIMKVMMDLYVFRLAAAN